MTPTAHEFFVGAGMIVTAGVVRAEPVKLPKFVPPPAVAEIPAELLAISPMQRALANMDGFARVALAETLKELPTDEQRNAVLAAAGGR